MRYVSIDLESSGLDPEKHQVLEFGAVIDDTENQLPLEDLPKFNVYIKHETIVGEAYALSMNARILDKISGREPSSVQVITPDLLKYRFCNFLYKNGLIERIQTICYKRILDIYSEHYPNKINVAGKNFANFDNLFLKKLSGFNEIQFHRRFLDVGPMFVQKEDKEVPGLEECLRRAGMEKTVAHTAIEDCLDVIKLIRFKIGQE